MPEPSIDPRARTALQEYYDYMQCMMSSRRDIVPALRRFIANGRDDDVLIFTNRAGNYWIAFTEVSETVFSIIGNQINVSHKASDEFVQELERLKEREGYTSIRKVKAFRMGDTNIASRMPWEITEIDDSYLFDGVKLVDKSRPQPRGEMPRAQWNDITTGVLSDLPF